MILRNAMFIQGTFSFEGCVFCALRFPGFTRAKKSQRFLRPRFDRDKNLRSRELVAAPRYREPVRDLSVCLGHSSTEEQTWSCHVGTTCQILVHLSLYFDNALPCL